MNFVILRSSRLRDRIGVDEPLGEADDADLEAARELDIGLAAERDLDAAAADVDDDRRLRRVDAVDGGEVNQPRFFGAGDDARADAGAPLDGAQERAAVFGFARRAGGDREDLVHLVRFARAARTSTAPAAPRSSPPASASCRRGRRRPAGPFPFRDRRLRTRSPGGPGPRSCGRNWCRCRWRRDACEGWRDPDTSRRYN